MQIMPIPKWFLVLGCLPPPDVLKAYAKNVKKALQTYRKQASVLGRAHRLRLEQKSR